MRAPPDGYTLLWSPTPNAINATLYDNLNFNFIRDIAPVAASSACPLVMVVHPIRSGQDGSRIHRLCQGQSGQDQHGVGRQRQLATHLAGELFKMMTGIDMTHVPYRGAGARASPICSAGRCRLCSAPCPPSIEHIRAGKLRALAVTSFDALGALAGRPDGRRIRAGLRGEQLVRRSARPRTRRPRSSTSSTGRSMRRSRTPR